MSLHSADSLSKSDLPFVWRPITLKVFLVFFYGGNLPMLFIGRYALWRDSNFTEFIFGLTVSLIITTTVWPFYKATLPEQIRGYRSWKALTAWFLIVMGAMFFMGDIQAAKELPGQLIGYMTGAGTFFYRIYLWLEDLPI